MITRKPSIQGSSLLIFWHISCKSFFYACFWAAEIMMHKVFCIPVFPLYTIL